MSRKTNRRGTLVEGLADMTYVPGNLIWMMTTVATSAPTTRNVLIFPPPTIELSTLLSTVEFKFEAEHQTVGSFLLRSLLS
jgi:hypothetical protein